MGAKDAKPLRAPPLKQLLLVVGVSLLTLASMTSMMWKTRSLGYYSLRSNRDTSTLERKLAVREAMQFVWKNYHERAFGADELKPVGGGPSNPWGGAGCMILDSMDTLFIMDLKEEFEQARNWVHEKLHFNRMGSVSVFETIIRSLGGLLSAYDLSKDPVILAKATELAERMIPAIDTQTGCANYRLDTSTNSSYQPGTLAESGTYQLEFEYLSQATGNPKYRDIARKFYPYLKKTKGSIRLYGLYANEIYALQRDGDTNPLTLTMGGGGDSFYEYLLKVWLFNGRPDESIAKEMYLEAVDGIESLLLQESTTGQLFIGEFSLRRNKPQSKMQHLACFVPGMLALGAERMRSENPTRSEHHLSLAKRLTKTCYEEFYKKQPTGLSPEYLEGEALDTFDSPEYLLRPEVVESLYILYKLTGDPVYQEWGWDIFLAIQRNCRTPFGFSEYRDVRRAVIWANMTTESERNTWRQTVLIDRMETFFTAETLKYLYLLFDPNNKHISLETHVFNTEAHPLSIANGSSLSKNS